VKVISGGQTGADQGALLAAKAAGFETGGWAPKHYRTETGPNAALGVVFGLQQHDSENYPPRTRLNVSEADLTLIFGDATSRGSALTIRICDQMGKDWEHIFFELEDEGNQNRIKKAAELVYAKLLERKPAILNVAGNRESSREGIQEFTRQVLRIALTAIHPIHEEF